MQWNHFVIRRAGTQFDMLHNGAIIATGVSAEPVPNTTGVLIVGRRNPGDGNAYATNGRVDEVAIWGRALSDAEIAALYNSGAGRTLLP